MAHCLKCKSKNLRRFRTRSRWERWRKGVAGKRPYRCRACQWRGWLSIGVADMAPAIDNRPFASDPPNLRGTLLARPDPRQTLDLKELDSFHGKPAPDDEDDEDDA